jgi:hypothetical protein
LKALEGASKGLINNNHNTDNNETITTTITERGGGEIKYEKSIAHLAEDLANLVAHLNHDTAQLIIDELADAVERANEGKREAIGRPTVWVTRLITAALEGTFKPDGARRIQRRRAREMANAQALASSSAPGQVDISTPVNVAVARAEFHQAKKKLSRSMTKVEASHG